MRRWIKRLLVVSSIILIVGLVLGVIGFAIRGWRGINLSLENGRIENLDDEKCYEVAKTQIKDYREINALKINVSSADINIIPTDKEFAYEYKIYGAEPEVSTDDRTFSFNSSMIKKNQINLNLFNFKNNSDNDEYFNLYVPYGFEFNNIDIRNSYGDVKAESMIVNDSIKVNLSYGDCTFNDCKLQKLSIDDSYGDVIFDKVFATDVSLNLSYGDVNVTNSNYSEITISNSYGDVNLNLNDDVDKVGYDLKTSFGDITVNGQEIDSDNPSSTANKKVEDIEVRSVKVDCSYGDIVLEIK